MSATPKRGWLSFSIRDIMLATAIVAIMVAWWLDRSRLAEQLQIEKTRGVPSMLEWDAPRIK
jgi:hypothetical protein